MTSARLIPSWRADSKSSGLQTQAGCITPSSLLVRSATEPRSMPSVAVLRKVFQKVLLVSNNSQIDGGISVFLDGGQQGGSVGISDFSWVEVILWIQQLHTPIHTETDQSYLYFTALEKRGRKNSQYDKMEIKCKKWFRSISSTQNCDGSSINHTRLFKALQ